MTTVQPASPALTEKDLANQYELGETGPATIAAPPVASGNVATPPAQAAPVAGVEPSLPVAAQPVPAVQHSPRLLRLAMSAGLDEKAIASTPSDELSLLIMERQAERLTTPRPDAPLQPAGDRPLPPRDAANGQFLKADRSTDHAALHRASKGLPPDAVEPGDEFKIDWGKTADGTPITDAEIHPALKHVIVAVRREIAEIRQENQQLKLAESVRMTDASNRSIDRVFQSLEGEYGHAIGKGSRETLDPDGVAFAHRVLIIKRAERLGQELSFPQRLAQAAKELFGGGTVSTPSNGSGSKPVAGSPPVNRVAEWTQAGLTVPTHLDGAAEPNGTHKAEQTAERKMRELGLEPEMPVAGRTSIDGFL